MTSIPKLICATCSSALPITRSIGSMSCCRGTLQLAFPHSKWLPNEPYAEKMPALGYAILTEPHSLTADILLAPYVAHVHRLRIPRRRSHADVLATNLRDLDPRRCCGGFRRMACHPSIQSPTLWA